jgi:hypothetical protein
MEVQQITQAPLSPQRPLLRIQAFPDGFACVGEQTNRFSKNTYSSQFQIRIGVAQKATKIAATKGKLVRDLQNHWDT